MPMKKMGSREACISYNYKEMIHAGHPKNQAQAAALNFCGKAWGGIKKKNKANELLLFLKADIELEMEGIKSIEEELAKTKKWIQKAVSPKTEGDFGDWCKSHGHGGVSQACINAAAKAGGHASKMALFAVNVSKGKYYYPSKKKKK
jgi:hypothetical protein